MRNATILVIRLKGTATETIKNLVLAGIGKLIFVDEENVSEEDLGAGFFFRDEDVGKKVIAPAKKLLSPDFQWLILGRREWRPLKLESKASIPWWLLKACLSFHRWIMILWYLCLNGQTWCV
jgi:hypothetical protein